MFTTGVWTFLFILITFTTYLYIGWRSRVRESAGFYIAGQGVPAIANGAATAADWMSAASFMSMAGLISNMGYDGSVYLMGWTGGFVLLALLLAPYLRKFGKYTVPDFVGDRYYSNFARVVAAICAIFISMTYVAGQMRGVGIVFSRFLGVDITVGVIVGVVIVAFFAVLGGMKGITWTQVAQYGVLIAAFLIPAIAIAFKLTGNPVPQIAFTSSDIVERLNGMLTDLGFASYTEPFAAGKRSRIDVFCITLALMAGTAGLPHVIVRFYTVPSVRAARYSAGWALLFIALLYTTAPALAAFARFNLVNSLSWRTIETGLVDDPESAATNSTMCHMLEYSRHGKSSDLYRSSRTRRGGRLYGHRSRAACRRHRGRHLRGGARDGRGGHSPLYRASRHRGQRGSGREIVLNASRRPHKDQSPRVSMSRLPSLRPAQVVATLKRAGFAQVRQRGSHAVYQHPDGREVIVPMHSQEMRRGTLMSVIKQAGFSQSEFLDLL